MINRSFECAGQDPRNVEFDPEFPVIENAVSENQEEEDIYFYHTDHLGSSSWITFTDGSVTQHLQNLPFGEPFIDQRATSYDIRFKFTGKEMDSETGYQYFGARYYDSDLSVWLSVDPLADKYPSTSAYMYTLGNPINLIDPNGMNAWIPPSEEGGKWTAESGDSPGSLARDAGISQSEAEGIMKDYNSSNGNNRSSDIMVYKGDQVSIPGSGSNSNESSNSGIDYTPSKEQQNIALPENYDPGSISEYDPSWVDEWSESDNFFASSSYDIADGIYVTVQSFVRGPKTQHLNGSQVAGGGAERTDAFVTTAEVGLTFGELSSFRIIKSGVYSSRWGLRIQAHSHTLSPLKGRGATGSMKPFHININNKHIITNPKFWKYYY